MTCDTIILKTCSLPEEQAKSLPSVEGCHNATLPWSEHSILTTELQTGCYLTYHLDSKLSKNMKKWHIAMVASINYALPIVRYASVLPKKDFAKDLSDLKHTIAANQMRAELNHLGIEFDNTSDEFLKLCREATKGLAEWVMGV